uniref:DUF434 domain-containing protein n=1 Tax=Tanacetum cinerariifolium TaxID=118510 RepID=A0A699U5G3_TANCI|nr:hypothetical protein [Tanacetum cinerariifolium]
MLRRAATELSWLLTRGYPPSATLKLVGDRYALTERQRWAVGRAACPDELRTGRAAKQLPPTDLVGRHRAAYAQARPRAVAARPARVKQWPTGGAPARVGARPRSALDGRSSDEPRPRASRNHRRSRHFRLGGA